MEHRFNLIDEPWIPVADKGRVGLKDIFTHPEYRMLGGNPVQKAAILKLLQAIAQAATTPKDMAAWQQLGWQGMAERVCRYLAQWHDRFYLYGPTPFLQMPAIAKAAIKSFGTVQPNVATGNTTVLTQSQAEQPLDDGERALLLITQMGFALGGKKTDNSVVLTPGYTGKSNDKGKPSTGKPGPSVAYMGLLHNYCLGTSLLESIWLNLFTEAEIADLTLYPSGLGIAPWEKMPEGEDCQVAKQLKGSLMGRLVPLCRFCLLADEGLHYSEGIAHGNYKEGVFDPSVAIDISGKEPKARWADPERRPWRELTSLLGFIDQGGKSLDCYQIKLALRKAKKQVAHFAIWSGGLRVSSNAGEQYASGSDDMVESLCWLSPSHVNALWFNRFQTEIGQLDGLAKTLYGCVIGYYKAQMMEGESLAKQASNLFWQLCERQSQALIDGCDEVKARQQLRRQFARYTTQVFDQFCPHQTARQMDAWAKTKPNLSAYLQQEQS
ncbi:MULTISPECIES: type I-E CRISPR-associated protein Cse1/CasA [Edwardsiella]|uniref:CRISPR-associated protein, Cse1 family n=2 Tax=Edwardsiella anguillarum TaxID=1821960 RepID=A0A076LR98_9GAMM|nr:MULTISPECIES: type I-E CRISPR-associated protein Cse1/CasA [Edwardsiella]AIJ09063.1 CRISPR-associated protein, Cse1 family [Edwardsiella anguillarum ET080813]AKR77027.1 type I-E CRISPR-associated protein Cse1/CasA [Edwardsiella sp. LADL05-105]KAB0587197.1 type I-E CRISPR-associated protein Cse1/CasA [Edwardsiella anguillarum]WHP84667.1 type I-E CRISPR-associated protein Cse1/CasA [Edwardsiella anguillarum]WHP88450.1 type I-E CRISPR-associated protein Cse1/CasA [Edwardsiella anguillarum]